MSVVTITTDCGRVHSGDLETSGFQYSSIYIYLNCDDTGILHCIKKSKKTPSACSQHGKTANYLYLCIQENWKMVEVFKIYKKQILYVNYSSIKVEKMNCKKVLVF